jgi:hypothetical protein
LSRLWDIVCAARRDKPEHIGKHRVCQTFRADHRDRSAVQSPI